MRTAAFLLILALLGGEAVAADPEFYRDVLPVLQRRCQSCHRAGETAPMAFGTYAEVRPWATAIREAVKLKKMPPWFADAASTSKFSNDPRLPEAEVAILDAWVAGGALEGKRPRSLPRPVAQADSFSSDLTLGIPAPFPVPANATIEYQYFVLRLPFTYDRWVTGVEVRPTDRSVVHHAVLYVRPPSSKWLRGAPADGRPWAPAANDAGAVAETRSTLEDILAVYTPGTRGVRFPDGMAKKVPAGSDLVLQVHYTSKKTPASDQTAVGLMLAADPPKKRILTLQMGRDDLRIPANTADYQASVSGVLPRDAMLINLTPHMHLRGSAFDFEAFPASGKGAADLLLRVRPYDFFWQFTYTLATPKLLPKGTVLKWTGYFDNSKNNPKNPDPNAEVTWGEQSWQEMMIGFFDVAVEPNMDKLSFFSRN
ncbi:MAG: thiol-disulfide isomerase [Bryobacteraceae bacterium]|nr:thiol-disulfide isomerase [Bryobacteraceae bacterium]